MKSPSLDPTAKQIHQASCLLCRPIDFEDELVFAAEKIGDVGAGRRLADKLEAFKGSIAQLFPKPLFRECFIAAELAGG